MSNLRRQLDNLPEIHSYKEFVEQRSILEKQLKDKFDHSITHSENCHCIFPTEQMCFSYALGLPDSVLESYYFNYRGFIQFLIDENYLKKDISGDFILYGDYPAFNHAAVRVNHSPRVRSKWGYGHIFEHEIDEVPESYGAPEAYTLLLSKEAILQKMKEYAEKIKYVRSRGVNS